MSPVNAKTGVEYQGRNAMFLAMAGFNSSEWGTFLQWKELGFKVKKGQKAQHIMKVVNVEDSESTKQAIRTYCVFNKEQVEEVKK